MDNYDEYIHQLQQNLQLFLSLIIEKPEFLKKVLRNMDANGMQAHQKRQPSGEKAPPKSSSEQTEQLALRSVGAGGPDIQKPKKIPIKEAKIFLDDNFKKIGSVKEWGDQMGYSTSYFWRKFAAHFHTRPKAVFIEKKKSALIKFIRANKNCTCTAAAQHIHLRDGNGLYQFVKGNFDCTPTELMRRVWNGEEIL